MNKRREFINIILANRDDCDDETYELFLQSLSLKELEELAKDSETSDDEL